MEAPSATRPGVRRTAPRARPESGFPVGGLEAEPYEVVVKAKPEGDNAHKQDRKAIVAPAVPSTWPVNTTPPAISGMPQPGETLTASTGSWTNPPNSGLTAADFSYEWLLCEGYEQEGNPENLGGECNPIGATGDAATYVVQPDEVAQTLRVKVKANNGTGNTAAVSAYEVVLAIRAALGPRTAAGAALASETQRYGGGRQNPDRRSRDRGKPGKTNPPAPNTSGTNAPNTT